jgi:hypothetical protein
LLRCTEGFPPAAAAAHRGWLARQYTTAAEMLAARNLDPATLQVGLGGMGDRGGWAGGVVGQGVLAC